MYTTIVLKHKQKKCNKEMLVVKWESLALKAEELFFYRAQKGQQFQNVLLFMQTPGVL